MTNTHKPHTYRLTDTSVMSFFHKEGTDSDEIPPIEFDGNRYHLNGEKASILNDFFIKQSTLEHGDDTPPNLSQLVYSLNYSTGLSVKASSRRSG